MKLIIQGPGPHYLNHITQDTLEYFKDMVKDGPESTPKKVYRPSDLTRYKAHIELAQYLWQEAAQEHYKTHGDQGTCIIGDGLEVEVLPPRCKYPRRIMIIPSHKVASCQGSIHYEATKHVAQEYLQALGLETHYNYGRMD